MKKRTKAMGIVLGALLLVTGSVLGTLAYLTSKDSVVNTFTVGKVEITLDEAKVNEYGEPVDKDGNEVDYEQAPRVDGNDYKLIPGHTYTKDPTVTLLKESEDSYVRMLVTITNSKEWDDIFDEHKDLKLDEIIPYDKTNWELVGYPENVKDNTRTYEFRYKVVVSALKSDNKLETLFTEIKFPGVITQEELETLEGFKMDVVAHAIQADGFETADAAWNAFGKQETPVTP